MNPRATLALFLAAGCAATARAQESYLVHYSWNEVNANTITQASGPLGGNSIVDPGEGARIRIGITAQINGTNAVGQTITYTNPPPGGTGTVKGVGAVAYDLIGDGNSASASGAWNSLQAPGFPFNFGLSPGTVQPGGASIHGMTATQLVLPGGSASEFNNNLQLFRGVWNPASYTPRTTNFLARPSILASPGLHNSVLLSYGIGTGIDITNGSEPYNYDLLVSKFIGTDFGNGLNIPIAPAPSTLALLGLSTLALTHRQRIP